MKTAVHLLDDFAMGGVERALGLFSEAEMRSIVKSSIEPVAATARFAKRYDADLIVLHMPPSWRRMPWLLSLRAGNPNARIVHVEHSYTSGFERHNVPHVHRFRAMLRLAFKLVDEVICVSHAQRQWLARMGAAPAGKLTTIHPWSGREELLGLKPACPAHGAPLRLAAYGRFAQVKNFGPLIEAVKGLGAEACSLRLGGTGPLQGELEKAALGAPNVALVGPVDDVCAFLAAADAVVVPSLHEAFGLVATEARLAGRPVLVADIDGLPEQAQRGGMIARCECAGDIAAGIMRLAQQPLAQMAIQARDSARGQRDEIVSGWSRVIERA